MLEVLLLRLLGSFLLLVLFLASLCGFGSGAMNSFVPPGDFSGDILGMFVDGAMYVTCFMGKYASVS